MHFTALCWWPKEKKIVRQENALDARFATLQENRGGHLGPIYWGSNQGLDFASTLMEFQAVYIVVLYWQTSRKKSNSTVLGVIGLSNNQINKCTELNWTDLYWTILYVIIMAFIKYILLILKSLIIECKINLMLASDQGRTADALRYATNKKLVTFLFWTATKTNYRISSYSFRPWIASL